MSRISSKSSMGISEVALAAMAFAFFNAAKVEAQAPAATPLRSPAMAKIYAPYPNEPIKPFRIIGNIYYVGRTNYTSFLITSSAGNILLDTEGEQYVPEIQKNIETLGFHLQDVKYLLQTHAHSDHVGGLAMLKELTGGKVAVMAQDAEAVAVGREAPGTEDRDDAEVPVMAQDASVLEDGGKSDFRGSGSVIWKPVRPDRILHDGEKVELGGVTMVAHLTAGHTKGCTAWSTVVEENGRKYNVVFVCSNRVNDGIPLLNNPRYPTVAEDFANGFKTLRSLPCDVFLASHAYMFQMEPKLKRRESGEMTNPFIDPKGCQNYIADYEAAFLEALQNERAGR